MSIRVLCVDDSALVRDILKSKLSALPDIEVVGTAPDPFAARDKILKLKPDVMTLDIEMPKMDGVAFLTKLMPQFPVRTIIVSSLTPKGGDTTLNALEAGAVDYVTKPLANLANGLPLLIAELAQKIRMASKVDVSSWKGKKVGGPVSIKATSALKSSKILTGSTDKIIALGASTGGTEALRALLQQMSPDSPGMAVVQHMPAGFTKKFAERLNEVTPFAVKEAETGDRIIRGTVLICPGDYHMKVIRSGGIYQVEVVSGEKVNGHKPSVEVMFDSVAEYVGNNALGIMLTGMGRDGADAMKRMRDAGARTIGQDETSSVVWGMPGEAYKVGAIEKQCHLDNMGNLVQKISKEMLKNS